MHNCKSARSKFIELALDELPPEQATQLLAELNNCPACEEEFAAMSSTLHVSNQALRLALPEEDFWPRYHARLHTRLLSLAQGRANGIEDQPSPARLRFNSQLWGSLKRIATYSIRVPVPAALAVTFLFGVSLFLLRSRGQVIAAPPTQFTSVETRTVPVPVVQEKVVTRVVYIEKKDRRSGRGAGQLDRTQNSRAISSVAMTGSDASRRPALSLAGFKPTDQVKLTVIKGSYQNEK